MHVHHARAEYVRRNNGIKGQSSVYVHSNVDNPMYFRTHLRHDRDDNHMDDSYRPY